MDRPVIVAWLVLVAALAARAATPFLPGMAWFGVNELRFLPPSAWLLLVAAAALCVPALARRAVAPVRGLGEWSARRPALAALVVGGAACALVVALPDRTAFVGDFLLREGAVQEAVGSGIFPQALPLDVLLHARIPAALVARHLLDANAAARALGAAEALALGALAVAFVRALRLRGAAAGLALCAVVFTGALGLLTGYGKAFSETCLLALAVAAFGVRAARDGESLGALVVTLALGLGTHRSAIAFLPAGAVAFALAARGEGARARFLRPTTLAGLVALAVTLVAYGPQIASTAMGFDMTQHFASAEVRGHGGLLAAALQPARMRDLLNVMLALTPLSPLVLLLADGGASWRTREGAVLAALWAGCGAVALLVLPAQGMFRDWDVFATAGMARAILAAWMLARVVDAGRSRAWLAPAVAAVCVATTVLGLWLAHDRARGLARVEAIVTGPPVRSDAERSKTWDFLGASWHLDGRDADAARAFGHATETSRNPRLYLQWAIMAANAGDLRESQRVLQELVRLSPGVGLAWSNLGSVSWQLHDYPEAARAARAIARLVPADRDAAARAEQLEMFARAWQDSVRAAGGAAR